MRYIVRAMREREPFLDPIRAELPALEVVWDRSHNAMETWLAAMDHAGNGAAVHLEDDILPTRGLLTKMATAVVAHPDHVIQFFSLRRSDRTLGSRWMAGGTFMMTQCFYLPPGYSAELSAYYPRWPRRHTDQQGFDTKLHDWLASRRERYWLHVPSLVQHRVEPSLIDPRRSSRRQSPTFVPA
jgi:hypothetical protein